jgi:DNA-binding LacI/PurR family transcriptional regulator
MNIDCYQIARIFDVNSAEIELKYKKWLEGKNKKSSIITADLNLLSDLSGLSTASISNFLNRKAGSLSKEKAEQLEKLSSLVGYLPSTAAKKLRRTQKMSIAFISPITDSPSPGFYTEILKGVKKEASKYNFYVDIYDVSEDEEKDFFANMPFLGMVDAIIIVSSKVSAEPIFPLIRRNIPVVLVHPWRKVENAPVTNSIVPDTAVFSQLLDHLFGEQRFGNPVLISLHPQNHIVRKMKIKLFKDALMKYSIPFDVDKNLFIIEQHTFSEGKRAFKELSSTNPEIDVFICLSDVVAASVSTENSKNGRKTAVTGYDNSDIARLFDLTTIDQKMEETGKIAFEKLFYAIQYTSVNKELPNFSSTIVPLEFVKRTSSMSVQNLRERR